MAENVLLKKAESISSNLQLKNIHLWQSDCKRDISFKSKNAEVNVHVEVKVLDTKDSKILPFGCRFQVSALDDDEEIQVFDLDIYYCVVYNILNDYKPKKAESEAFGLTSAIFNAWPYVREYVHNTLVRMDLTAFVMPPITIAELSKLAKNKAKKS